MAQVASQGFLFGSGPTRASDRQNPALVNPGHPRRKRGGSDPSPSPEGLYRIHSQSPPRRQETGPQCYQQEETGHTCEGCRIGYAGLEEHSLQEAAGAHGHRHPQNGAEAHQQDSPIDNQPQDFSITGPQRDTNPYLVGPLGDEEGQDPIEAQRRQGEGNGGEQTNDGGDLTGARDRVGNDSFHALGLAQDDVTVQRPDPLLNGLDQCVGVHGSGYGEPHGGQ